MSNGNGVPGQVPGPPFFQPVTPLPAVTPPSIPFDNGITDIPSQQDSPDNGPYRPPVPPNPAPTGLYEYIAIPRQPPVPPEASYYEAFTVFQQIESQFALQNIYAERIDLWNEVRVYRVPTQYVWKFCYDKKGPYINAIQCRYYLQVDDPTTGQSATNYWIPVLS